MEEFTPWILNTWLLTWQPNIWIACSIVSNLCRSNCQLLWANYPQQRLRQIVPRITSQVILGYFLRLWSRRTSPSTSTTTRNLLQKRRQYRPATQGLYKNSQNYKMTKMIIILQSKPKERLKKIQSSHSTSNLKHATWTTFQRCINPQRGISRPFWNRLLLGAPLRLRLLQLKLSSPLLLIMRRPLKSIWAVSQIKVSTLSQIWNQKMASEVTWELESPLFLTTRETFMRLKMPRSTHKIPRSLMATLLSRAITQSM